VILDYTIELISLTFFSIRKIRRSGSRSWTEPLRHLQRAQLSRACLRGHLKALVAQAAMWFIAA
jgi:hypothetical protein